MKTVGVACVKNEADIVEAFVRHNLFYLDALLILNHAAPTPRALSCRPSCRKACP